ncbi:MAG TPA: ABC transporter ATP-binding protein [Bryobacteraceae bacterium]|nr:ABC transporter ATP-binding protein [Bryobacteraceae bacterium]
MVAATEPARQSTSKTQNKSGASVSVSNVSVEYTLLTEDQRTLKGRLLSAFGGRPDSAKFWALRNVSCDISAGETVGVLGRNGSGKSTLLKVMSRVIKPVEGSVTTSGTVQPLLELGAAINMELTGRENVILNAALLRRDRQQVLDAMPQIQAFAELGTFFDIPVKTYSSGMYARLAFAMSTQISPEILIVDEVLGVGDEQFQRKCYARMKKLMESGSIVVLVSHNTALIEQLCTRGIYLKHGQMLMDGPVREVTARYRADLERG